MITPALITDYKYTGLQEPTLGQSFLRACWVCFQVLPPMTLGAKR